MPLRFNTTLTLLRLNQGALPPQPADDPERLRPLVEVLDTFNFTLENVQLGSALAGSAVAETIRGLLHRNFRIRKAVERLQPRDYHVSPPSLWPSTLGLVSSFPALLYRFLRRGNLNELCDRLRMRQGRQEPGPTHILVAEAAEEEAPPGAPNAGEDKQGDARASDGIHIVAYGFREAAHHLEAAARGHIRDLFLTSWRGPAQAQADHLAGISHREFCRFVELLGQCSVRGIEFSGNVDWNGLAEVDVARLFGDILPAHRTLTSVKFFCCDVPAQHLALFTSSLQPEATRLATLRFDGGTVDRELAEAIADMLHRKVPLSTLVVGPFGGGGLDADSSKLICRSASNNKFLRSLEITVRMVLVDTLDDVTASSSPLQELVVRAATTIQDDVVAALARQLRTNTTITRLSLCSSAEVEFAENPDLFRPLEEMLEEHNCTLDSVVVSRANPPPAPQARMNAILCRTRHVKRALSMLPLPCHLSPHLFAVAGCRPTLLYRFLRRSDAKESCQLFQQRTVAKKRAARLLPESKSRTSHATSWK